jgi:dipeptidase E
MGGRDRGSGVPIDDPTAITVTDGTVEVVSEGDWRLFPS